MTLWQQIRPAWVCRNSIDCGNHFVTTANDEPPEGWVRRWRGWGGWAWFCGNCDPKKEKR